MRPYFVVHRPSLWIIDGARLLENVAPVDPLAIRPTGVLGDHQGLGQAIKNLAVRNRSIVDKHAVVGVEPGVDALTVQSTVIGFAFRSLRNGNGRAHVHRDVGLSGYGVGRVVVRVIKIHQLVDLGRFHVG